MTRFFTREKKEEKQPKKKTVFKKEIYTHTIISSVAQPSDYENVEFLFHDVEYGDVFRAWHESVDEFGKPVRESDSDGRK